MNEVVEYENVQLPDTLEDLTQFVLVGKAKLQAYMLKLQTVNKLSVAQEIRDQTLKEAQEISTALIAAEQRIGELLLAIPKATAYNNPSGKSDTQNRDESNLGKPKSKSETISEMGYSKDEASDYQRMAKNPEIVRKVIDEAIANGEVVTKSQVLKEIKAERDKAKAEMTDLREERDYLQSQVEELQNAEPKVVTKTVEKIPADYESLKKKAKEAAAWKKDYENQQIKTGEKQRKILELQDEIKRLQEQTAREQSNNDMVASAIMFATQCKSFIESVGGYVFLSEHFMELPERERKGYQIAAQAVHDWAQVVLNNIERSTHELLE